MAIGVDTHNVFRLEVQVNNFLLMNVGDPLQDLLHVAHAGQLRVLKVVIDNTLKQFPAWDTAEKKRESAELMNTHGEIVRI